MNTKHGVEILSEIHFTISPIWKYNDTTDFYEPIFTPDAIPDDSRDLRIKSEFITPSGMKFFGYIVGVENIFSIAIFIAEKKIRFNKNLEDMSLEQFNEFKKIFFKKKREKITNIFPLKYTTMINLPGWKNISGEFDAFEKLKKDRWKLWKRS